MIGKFLNTLLLVAFVVLQSCKDCNEATYVGDFSDPDAVVNLSVRINGPDTRVADPGVDHWEWNADWKNLELYFVYPNSVVMQYSISHEMYSQNMKFAAYEGDVRVFAVAFPEEHMPEKCQNSDGVYNMKTLDLKDMTSEKRQHYMQNMFCGISETMTIEKDNPNVLNIVCNRIAAKVDIQYDVQPGIDGGTFVNAEMSEISFKGSNRAYLFADYVNESVFTPEVFELKTVSGAISGRNGRAYTYVLPGMSSMDFVVGYNVDGTPDVNYVSYEARFQNDLKSDAWYKVNFSVNGKTVAADGPVSVVIQ